MTFKEAVEAAIHKEKKKRERLVPFARSSVKKCSVGGCSRQSRCKGLCNAHYLRMRAGQDLEPPIKHAWAGATCSECDKPVDSKGGWGLCKGHYRRLRPKIIKGALVRAFGGLCTKCKKRFPDCVFDFHHRAGSKKEGAISALIMNSNIKRICDEVEKCILLCANCHRRVHFNEI